MAADRHQRTEKPTPRKLEKARKEGRFPVSREFVSAVQFTVFVALAGFYGRDALAGLTATARYLIDRAFHAEVSVAECRRLFAVVGGHVFQPLLAGGAGLVAASLAAHLSVTRLGFAAKNLRPDFGRLSPLRRVHEVRRHNVPQFLQAAVLLPLFCYAVWVVASGNLDRFLQLPFMGVQAAVRVIGRSIDEFLWKATGAILLWGLVDLVRQKRRFNEEMRMTRQEVKDEAKETEGNPEIKARIRRMRRDLLRRQMMKQVPKATAVVVNPTHYAVALRYEMESMAAPMVVAKGKNYLAQRIRRKAVEHQVPIVENPPLAQALYKTAEVGQEIPVALYRAVAEILAYIFRLRQRRR